MKSKWKPNYTNNSINSILFAQQQQRKRSSKYKITPLEIFDRSSTILQCFTNLKVLVHNGRNFAQFTIKEFMIGHKFGEYAPTRLIGKSIHNRKKKKKK